MKLTIDMYESTTKKLKFISVPAGEDILKITSEVDDPDYSDVEIRELNKIIEEGVRLIAMSSDDIIKQINEKGYALHASKITVV